MILSRMPSTAARSCCLVSAIDAIAWPHDKSGDEGAWGERKGPLKRDEFPPASNISQCFDAGIFYRESDRSRSRRRCIVRDATANGERVARGGRASIRDRTREGTHGPSTHRAARPEF